jgi:hypothetical protein
MRNFANYLIVGAALALGVMLGLWVWNLLVG